MSSSTHRFTAVSVPMHTLSLSALSFYPAPARISGSSRVQLGSCPVILARRRIIRDPYFLRRNIDGTHTKDAVTLYGAYVPCRRFFPRRLVFVILVSHRSFFTAASGTPGKRSHPVRISGGLSFHTHPVSPAQLELEKVNLHASFSG
ncbi:hypothetical protein C8R45DRAFT_1105392 [Mycena sanguinolenta]|nr:hypothetical protein C8R45DRAFT_1105392 [Mycena sanguinolenta]